MKRFLVMFAILATGFVVLKYQTSNPIRVEKVSVDAKLPLVNVQIAKVVDSELKVLAHGIVDPVTRTDLVSEVSGAVVEVSEKLKIGGEFREGELMLKLEPIAYLQALEQAKLNVAEAELRVVQESTRASQAMRDWKKLGRPGEPSSLSLREPQLKAARALLASSEVAMKKAQYDLAATELVAPYDCFVVAAHVDDGGYISSGVKAAQIYSMGEREVRLPVKLEYLSFLNEQLIGRQVELMARVGGGMKVWLGHVERLEGVVDRMTHSVMLVVKLDDPQGALPPFGLYVDSDINLGALEGVVELPGQALRDNSTVLVVDKDNKIKIQPVEVSLRQNGKVYLQDNGLAGKAIVVSPMDFAIAGMEVEQHEHRAKEDK